MSDRALVTGVSGFIGHHLVQTLIDRGQQVAGLVRPTSNTSDLPLEKLDLRIGDVTDPASLEDAVREVDVVYHLAGTLEGRSLADLNVVNEAGSRNIARACAALQSPPVLILLSSLEAAGPDVKGRLRTEADPSAPVSNYGRSKLAGELAVMEFADQVPITIVRASAVFGERDPQTLALFNAFQIAGLGIHPLPRAHSTKLSVIHAGDLAEHLRLAAASGERLDKNSNTPGQGLYYAAYEQAPNLAELIRTAAEARGEQRVWIIDVPIAFAWIVGAVSETSARLRGRSPGIVNLDKVRSAAAGSFTCSSAKSAQQLGFLPSHSLSDRIGQTVAWYQAKGLL